MSVGAYDFDDWGFSEPSCACEGETRVSLYVRKERKRKKLDKAPTWKELTERASASRTSTSSAVVGIGDAEVKETAKKES